MLTHDIREAPDVNIYGSHWGIAVNNKGPEDNIEDRVKYSFFVVGDETEEVVAEKIKNWIRQLGFALIDPDIYSLRGHVILSADHLEYLYAVTIEEFCSDYLISKFWTVNRGHRYE